MLYILLRVLVFTLYLIGIEIVNYGYVNTYLAIAIYLLIFIIHIVHLRRFKKQKNHKLGFLLVLDILIFGMLPILELKNKKN